MIEPRAAARVGLVQVYTGDGKGKTTAALGMALRAAGHHMRVYVGQFLKLQTTGEVESLRQLASLITVRQHGTGAWVRNGEAHSDSRAAATRGLAEARTALAEGGYDLVILDEINTALSFGLLREDAVVELIDGKPASVELILTGRGAPDSILARADLITEMRAVRHPFEHQIMAREGIEY